MWSSYGVLSTYDVRSTFWGSIDLWGVHDLWHVIELWCAIEFMTCVILSCDRLMSDFLTMWYTYDKRSNNELIYVWGVIDLWCVMVNWAWLVFDRRFWCRGVNRAWLVFDRSRGYAILVTTFDCKLPPVLLWCLHQILLQAVLACIVPVSFDPPRLFDLWLLHLHIGD